MACKALQKELSVFIKEKVTNGYLISLMFIEVFNKYILKDTVNRQTNDYMITKYGLMLANGHLWIM